MKDYKPAGYPLYIPAQHAWYAEKWDKQHNVPVGALNQWFDWENRELHYEVDGIEHQVHVLTPPPWVSKRMRRK